MGKDFDFLSIMGADWPEPVIPLDPPTLPVLEDDLACLQLPGHAADSVIREAEADDLLQQVLGMGQAELTQVAAHAELLKNFVADAEAEFAVPAPPSRPAQLPTRRTPISPVKVPSKSPHHAPLEKILARAFPVSGHSGNVSDAWHAVLSSMEDFVVRAVDNCVA